MSIRISVNQKAGGHQSIWIDHDTGFNANEFYELISVLEIQKTERVHESMGPLEYTDEIYTSHGQFRLHWTFDGFAGIALSSDEGALMSRIIQIMLNSGEYVEAEPSL